MPNLYRFDDPTKKPDVSQLSNYRRFAHPRYRGRLLDVLGNEGGGAQLHNYAERALAFTANHTWEQGGMRIANGSTDIRSTGTEFHDGDWEEPSIVARVFNLSVSGTQSYVNLGAISNSDNGKAILRSNAGSLEYYHFGTNYHIYTSTTAPLVANTWYTLGMRYRKGVGSSMDLYLDGAPLAGSWTFGNGNEAPHTRDVGLSIGSLFGFDPCNAVIAYVYYYNRYLSDSEMQSFADAPYLEYTLPRVWVVVPQAGPFQSQSQSHRRLNLHVGAGL